MEFPPELKQAIEKQAGCYPLAKLKQAAGALSGRYRFESGTGKQLLTEEIEAAVYSVVRMPATYGAVSAAMGYALEAYEGPCTSLLDAGAGSGAATWAAAGAMPLEFVTCLEREGAMRKLGEAFMKEGGSALQNARWITGDLLTVKLETKADVVLSSYVLNEMAESDRAAVLQKLWETAGGMLLIVEPGTPAGFAVLKEARALLLGMGAHLAAPCPHEEPCRLAGDDWCHFTCRVQRSKLHKLLKEGDAPYEDEKFAYMAFVKQGGRRASHRILRHPYIEKGQIRLELCGADANRAVCVKKKDGQLFKTARKAKCGDSIAFLEK